MAHKLRRVRVEEYVYYAEVGNRYFINSVATATAIC